MPDFLLYSKIEGVIDQAVPVSAAPYFTAPVSKTCLSPNDLQKCPNGNKVISIYLVDQTAHTKSSKSSFLNGKQQWHYPSLTILKYIHTYKLHTGILVYS